MCFNFINKVPSNIGYQHSVMCMYDYFFSATHISWAMLPMDCSASARRKNFVDQNLQKCKNFNSYFKTFNKLLVLNGGGSYMRKSGTNLILCQNMLLFSPDKSDLCVELLLSTFSW